MSEREEREMGRKRNKEGCSVLGKRRIKYVKIMLKLQVEGAAT